MNSVNKRGGIHSYMAEKIQHLGERAGREVLGGLNQVANISKINWGAAGSINGRSRNDSRGSSKLGTGRVIKLTENAERSERREQVLGNLYKTTHQVMVELGENREATIQTQKEIVLRNQKLHGRLGTLKVKFRGT